MVKHGLKTKKTKLKKKKHTHTIKLPSYILAADRSHFVLAEHLQRLLCNQCTVRGLLTCLQLIRSHLSPGPPTPSDTGGLGTATAEMRQPQEGATRSPPSKADLLKMKDLILTDSSVEAS